MNQGDGEAAPLIHSGPYTMAVGRPPSAFEVSGNFGGTRGGKGPPRGWFIMVLLASYLIPFMEKR